MDPMEQLAVPEKIDHDENIENKGSESPYRKMGMHGVDLDRNQGRDLEDCHVFGPAESPVEAPGHDKVQKTVGDSPDRDDQEHVGSDEAGFPENLPCPSIVDIDIEVLGPMVKEVVEPHGTKGETTQTDQKGKQSLRNPLQNDVF